MPATVLLLLFGDLGDTVLTVPAVRAIRTRYPQARLLVMSNPSSGEYVRRLGLADDIVPIDKHLFDGLRSLTSVRAALRFVRLFSRLRAESPDWTVAFQHLSTRWGAVKFALVMLASGAPNRAGLDNGRGWFFTHRVQDRGFGAVHESDYWLDVAALLDAPGTARLEVSISEQDTARAAALLGTAETNEIWLAVHPGVGWYGPGRQWGPSNFAETAAIVRERGGARWVVVGSELDRAAADAVLSRLGTGAVDLVGKTDMGELAAVLRRCALLLSNDSGVAHLAAAAGTETLTVFGPSNDSAWRPLGGGIVTADVPCRPCMYRDFEIGLRNGCATRECLGLITPADVARRVLGALDGSKHPV